MKETSWPIYEEPLYYEIAFSFVDVNRQIDMFLEYVEKHGRKNTKTVIDIACGPSLQLPEFARRGFFVAGLDICPNMLNYLEEKLIKELADYDLYLRDIRNFTIDMKFDLAFILMGSIHYLQSNDEYLSHLASMARIVKKGGLYLIENLPMVPVSGGIPCWTQKRDNIEVRTSYRTNVLCEIAQTSQYEFLMDIKQGWAVKRRIIQKSITKNIYPQEFISLVKQNGKFEMVGFFHRDNMTQLEKTEPINLVVLRRK
jgi:ubiquinone/menaquinone biosynthesis C-methylase UbiE